MRNYKTFKQFISETSAPTHFLETREEIENWLEKSQTTGAQHIIINDDLTLDASDDIQIFDMGLVYPNGGQYGVLPVQFNHCKHNFVVGPSLASMVGCPNTVDGMFNVFGNKALTSLEGCPKKAEFYNFANTGIKSFKGINKLIENASTIYISQYYQSGLLPFLLVKGLTKVAVLDGNYHRFDPNEKRIAKAAAIISKHLAADRDFVDCQQELIDAGLKEFANT